MLDLVTKVHEKTLKKMKGLGRKRSFCDKINGDKISKTVQSI